MKKNVVMLLAMMFVFLASYAQLDMFPKYFRAADMHNIDVYGNTSLPVDESKLISMDGVPYNSPGGYSHALLTTTRGEIAIDFIGEMPGPNLVGAVRHLQWWQAIDKFSLIVRTNDTILAAYYLFDKDFRKHSFNIVPMPVTPDGHAVEFTADGKMLMIVINRDTSLLPGYVVKLTDLFIRSSNGDRIIPVMDAYPGFQVSDTNPFHANAIDYMVINGVSYVIVSYRNTSDIVLMVFDSLGNVTYSHYGGGPQYNDYIAVDDSVYPGFQHDCRFVSQWTDENEVVHRTDWDSVILVSYFNNLFGDGRLVELNRIDSTVTLLKSVVNGGYSNATGSFDLINGMICPGMTFISGSPSPIICQQRDLETGEEIFRAERPAGSNHFPYQANIYDLPIDSLCLPEINFICDSATGEIYATVSTDDDFDEIIWGIEGTGSDSVLSINDTTRVLPSWFSGYIRAITRQVVVNIGIVYKASVNTNGILITQNICSLTFANEETGSNAYIKLYPNPNNGSFTILNSSGEHGHLYVEDMKGNMVFASDLFSGTQQFTTSLAKGLYLVRVELPGGTTTKRLMIR